MMEEKTVIHMEKPHPVYYGCGFLMGIGGLGDKNTEKERSRREEGPAILPNEGEILPTFPGIVPTCLCNSTNLPVFSTNCE
jgi:hypothetical protein